MQGRTAGSTDGVYQGMRAALAAGCVVPHRPGGEHELHLDADAICPRCMEWIEPGDFVRRTAYGPHQHESCA